MCIRDRLHTEEYEIRLIIYETRDVPLVDGDKVDIYLKATYMTDEWDESNVCKQTDVHNNSKDGRGEFNYRMLFRAKMPAEFPRIKL